MSVAGYVALGMFASLLVRLSDSLGSDKHVIALHELCVEYLSMSKKVRVKMICERPTHLYCILARMKLGNCLCGNPSRSPPRQRQAASVEHGASNLVQESFGCV